LVTRATSVAVFPVPAEASTAMFREKSRAAFSRFASIRRHPAAGR
jgi:hypothetical protein